MGDFRRITLDNGVVRAVFLPELGGKMISLVRKASGREFLLSPAREYRRAAYGAAFEEFDTSGFDECVPTISECQFLVQPPREQRLPDHGEVWSLPWEYEIAGEELFLSVRGICSPYTFAKKLRLRENILVIEYEIRNQGALRFTYLWSAHPLLRIEPGARVLLPDEVRELLVYWSNNERLGRNGESCSFPLITNHSGCPEDLRIIKQQSAGTAEKFFTPRLQTGYCGLHFPSVNESIIFDFDVKWVPYVGLWLCQGGWPAKSEKKHFTVALEPCNARSDSLAEAASRKECPILDIGACHRWTLQIQLCTEIPNLESRPEL
jgi:hypothetical protein